MTEYRRKGLWLVSKYYLANAWKTCSKPHKTSGSITIVPAMRHNAHITNTGKTICLKPTHCVERMHKNKELTSASVGVGPILSLILSLHCMMHLCNLF